MSNQPARRRAILGENTLRIQAALLAKGYTGADVARELGITTSAVSDVIRGRSTSRNVEDRISEITGIPHDEIFPPKEKLNAVA